MPISWKNIDLHVTKQA